MSNWYIRLTRFASVHMVYSQMAQNSCGIACMMMVNFKIKKGLMFAGLSASAQVTAVPVVGAFVGPTLARAAINYAIASEPQVYREYTRVTGSPYDGSSYSDCTYFPAVLQNLGLGNWETVWVGQNGWARAAKDATTRGAPVIGLVAWSGGGAHFVVVDEFYGDYACVNDPWDGQVHVTRMQDGQPVTYNAEPVIGWSIGGSRHSYPVGQTGTFNGWIVRRV